MLHDRIAEAMTVTGEDPEIEIHRSTSRVAPPQWEVEVRAGQYVRCLPLDIESEEAMRAAVAIFLVELVQDLRGELPAIMGRPEVVDAVANLLRNRTDGCPGPAGDGLPS